METDKKKNQYGTLYCVSVGPGDPELLTLKAVRVIKECEVAAFAVLPGGSDRKNGERIAEMPGRGSLTTAGKGSDPESKVTAADKIRPERGTDQERIRALRESCLAYRIAVRAVPELKEKEALCLRMPMTKDEEILERSHRTAADAIAVKLREGKNVAWLTLGDVTVYATSMYAAARVREMGYRTEIVSGVTSFCAAAACLGETLVSGDEELHIIPASYGVTHALEYPGVRVFMKAGRTIRTLGEELQKDGLSVKGVERCGLDGERIFQSAGEIDETAGYYTILIAREKRQQES